MIHEDVKFHHSRIIKHDSVENDNNVEKLNSLHDPRFFNINLHANPSQFGSSFNPAALSQLTQQSRMRINEYDYARRNLIASEDCSNGLSISSEMLQNSLVDPMGLRSGIMFSIDTHGNQDHLNPDNNGQNVVRTRRRKTGISEEERVCVVCGEPASGYNFDRLTCESCKAFFRRNALKPRDKIKKCNRGGVCNIEGNQRKHCPSCRLEKCLAAAPEKLEQRAKPRRRKNPSQTDDVASVSSAGGNPGPDLTSYGSNYGQPGMPRPSSSSTSPPIPGSTYNSALASSIANGTSTDHNSNLSSLAFAMAAMKQQQPNIFGSGHSGISNCTPNPFPSTAGQGLFSLGGINSLQNTDQSSANLLVDSNQNQTYNSSVNDVRSSIFEATRGSVHMSMPDNNRSIEMVSNPNSNGFDASQDRTRAISQPGRSNEPYFANTSSNNSATYTNDRFNPISQPAQICQSSTSNVLGLKTSLFRLESRPKLDSNTQSIISGLSKSHRCYISWANGDYRMKSIEVLKDQTEIDRTYKKEIVACRHRRCRRIYLRLLVMRHEHIKRKSLKLPINRKRPRIPDDPENTDLHKDKPGIRKDPIESIRGPQLSIPNELMRAALIECVQRIREPFTPSEQLETGAAETLEQEYNRMDTCIRRIIRVVKLLPYFNDIGKTAQLGLLRANIYGLIVLYSSFFFKRDVRKLCYPVLQTDGIITTVQVAMLDDVPSTNNSNTVIPDPSTVTVRTSGSNKTVALREDFELYKANTLAAFDQLDQLAGNDDTLRVALLAIKLFSEDALPSECRGSVSTARHTYLSFLWHYIRWNVGGKKLRHASELFERLLIAFIDLRTLEIRMTEFAKLLSLDGLSPLMREVCGNSQKSVTAPTSIHGGTTAHSSGIAAASSNTCAPILAHSSHAIG